MNDTVSPPGDRVRVLAPRQNMTVVTAFFGDSYRVLNEVDILTFSLGLALGSLLGPVPIPPRPAVLGFALEQTSNELPNVGYATVYPIATVTKIILAQLLLVLLS